MEEILRITNCDACSELKKTYRQDTEGGIIYICKHCVTKLK